MKTIKISLIEPEKDKLNQAAEVLKNGGVIVYPTDTAYGIGVDITNTKALKKLYKIKERDKGKPTHIVVRDWEMIEEYTYTNNRARILYDKLIPGPLTIVLPKKANASDILTGGLTTLGVRIPNNTFTTALSEIFPYPYTTPSANRSGASTPYSIDEVKEQLSVEKVDLLIDSGKLIPTPPSTIIDLSSKTPKILRSGPITKTEIENILEEEIDEET